MKAISRNENGAVVINYKRCIGCRMCLNACPLGNITYHPEARRVFKCDLCDGDPKCARYCPGHAIVYEDTDTLPDKRKLVGEKYRDVIAGEEVS